MGIAIPQVVTEDRASGSQVIDGSLKFKDVTGNGSTDGTDLRRTPGSSGNLRTHTWSSWIKRTKYSFDQQIFYSGVDANNTAHIRFDSDDTITVFDYTTTFTVNPSRKFRDTGWYHVVVAIDTTQSTDSDRVKIYVNGNLETSFDTSTYPAQNLELDFNRGSTEHSIGRNNVNGNNYFCGSLAQVYWIDGQALDPSYFGYTDALTNTWRPKKFSGTFTQSTTQYTGATALTWDDNPIGSKWTLSNSNKTATGTGSASYTGGNVWSNAISANTTVAWTLDVTNGDTTGGWYFTDSQTATATHPDELSGNTLGLRGGETSAGTYGTFASANGTSSAQAQISLNSSVSPNGTKKIDFVVYRPASGTGKVWVKGNLDSTWIGGGDPSNTSSTASFIIPDGTTYFAFIGYDTSSTTTLTLAGDGNIISNQGTNSFYLPMDGNSLIGEDKSGKGNNWTPVNFGGFNTLEKATGALPILNTDGGGKVARVGVRTDSNSSSLVLALPLVGSANDVSNQINSGSTTKTVTVTNAVASSVASNFYGGSYYFDGTGDYLSFSNNADFAFGTGDFTVECFVYPSSNANYRAILDSRASVGDANGWILGINGNDSIYIYSNGFLVQSANGAVSENRWHHVAYVRSSGTHTLYVNGISVSTSSTSKDFTTQAFRIGATAYNGTENWFGYLQDVRIYKGVVKYTSNFIPASTNPDILPDTPSGVSGGSKLAKVIDGAVAFDGTGDYLSGFGGSAILPTSTGTAFVVDCFWYSNGNSTQKGIWEQHSSGSGRTAYFVNNGSAYLISEGNTVGTFTYGDKRWYFTRIIYDGSGNIYHYVDGVLIGSGTQTVGIDDTGFQIGAYSTDCFNGFISNFRIVVGSNSLSGTDIPTAPLTNVTNTSLLCCQSNTSATAAAVTPGSITANGNSAATNFNPFTTDINAVRGQESGYATLNPLEKGSDTTLSEGNLKAVSTNSTGWESHCSTLTASTGKWYFETECVAGSVFSIGIADASDNIRDLYTTDLSPAYAYNYNGKKYSGGTTDGGVVASAFTAGDLIGCAFDLDAGTIRFYKNGIDQGVFFSDVQSDIDYKMVASTRNATVIVNFGQKPFKFPPPEGFQPLNAANVRPATVIARPDQYVGVTTYTGTTDNPATITSDDFSFTPDFVWVKSRSNAESHALYDSVRGATYRLRSDTTAIENTGANELQSFIPGGFTAGNNGHIYFNGYDYVAWTWKAGGNSNTFNIDDVGYATASAAGLTAGTITPTGASVNTKSGFSIIKYTGNQTAGAKVPHGLSQTPDFTIVKQLTGTEESWRVRHSSADPTKTLYLNQTVGEVSNTEYISGADSTTITLSSGLAGINVNANYIVYAWHNVPGLQKFGSYTGNGSQNFVELGFKPALVIAKRAVVNSSPDQGNDYASWTIMDFKRLSYNGLTPNHLFANKNSNEGKRGNGALTTGLTDMTLEPLSNGFYLNGPGTEINANTGTYIYAAWAEAPSFNLYGGQSNAR